jgi:nicotinamide-nucleotide amidase
VFDRAFVTYSNDAKKEMLGVRGETLEKVGAVSEEVAGEMALNAVIRSRANVAVAVTGLAGPGGSDFKPEGRVCFGISVKNGHTVTETVDFGAIGRRNVRLSTVERALNLLLEHAKQEGESLGFH